MNRLPDAYLQEVLGLKNLGTVYILLGYAKRLPLT